MNRRPLLFGSRCPRAFSLALSIFVSLLWTGPAAATDWISPGGGFFLQGENWDGGEVPADADNATFSLDAEYTVVLGDAHEIVDLFVRRGTVNLDLGELLEIGFDLTVGEFEYAATLRLQGDGGIGAGSIRFGEGESRLVIDDEVTLSGTDMNVGNFDGGRAEVIVSDEATLSVETVGILEGGSLAGGGTIQGSVQNSGVLRPTGSLNVGELIQENSGVIEFEVRDGAGSHDRIVCQDSAVLDGILLMRFRDTYQPTNGDSFTVIESGALSNSFDAVLTEGLPPHLTVATLVEAGNMQILVGPSSPTEIVLGRTEFAVADTSPVADFFFSAPKDLFLVVTLGGGIETALFARVGGAASETLFDAVSAQRGSNLHRLSFSLLAGSQLFLRAQGNVINKVSNLTLSLRDVAISLTEATATTSSVEAEQIAMTLYGAGLTQDTTFQLEPTAGGDVLGTLHAHVPHFDRAEVIFDLSSAVVGTYDIVAVNGAGKDRLQAAFEVVSGTSPPSLAVEVTAVDRYRRGRIARLGLRYQNVGDTELVSPLLRIRGGQATELKLERDAEFQSGPLYVLALQPGGLPGRLAPGSSGELSVFFRDAECSELSCPLELIVERLSGADVPIGWDEIARPSGINVTEWQETFAPLSQLLGARWSDFEANLGRVSAAVSRRGRDATSALDVFRYAFDEASPRRSNGAILGWLRDVDTGEPLREHTVAAVLGEEIAQAAQTDDDGTFVLEGLVRGGKYELLVEGGSIVECGGCLNDDPVIVPLDDSLEEVLDLRVRAKASEPLVCTECKEADAPGLVFPPDELFAAVETRVLTIVSSFDPNEKQGPGEADTPIPSSSPLLYTVYFENLPQATAAAQQVIVSDDLDLDLDPTWVEFVGGAIGSSAFSFSDEGRDRFSGYRRLADGQRYAVEASFDFPNPASPNSVLEAVISAGVDLSTGRLRWSFTSLDPRTGDLPAGADEGLLPPNDASGAGEGFLQFLVRTESLANGTIIENEAAIEFDSQQSITTNRVRNIVQSAFAPDAPAQPVPDSRDGTWPVDTNLAWSSDPLAETYDVFLWPEGEERPAEPTFDDTSINTVQPVMPLDNDTTYNWQVEAESPGGMSQGEVWQFTTDPERPCPAAPSAPTPAPGATVLLKPTLDWDDLPEAQFYTIFLWRPNEAKSVLVTGIVQSEYTLRVDLEDGADYQWQVVAQAPGCQIGGPTWSFTASANPVPLFRRGDADGSGELEITDAIFVLTFLFNDGERPGCLRAADSNGSQEVDISDPSRLLSFLFLGGDPLPPPFPGCGEVEPGPLECEDPGGCP